MSYYRQLIFHWCAVCARQLEPNRTHILCEKCRIECGGYGHYVARQWAQYPPATAPLSAYIPWGAVNG